MYKRQTYYYTVTATDGTVFSKRSNEIAVTTKGDLNTGVSAVAGASGIRMAGRLMVIPAGVDVTVSDLSGRLIYRAASQDADVSVTLPAAGVYVIKHNGNCRKVIVM